MSESIPKEIYVGMRFCRIPSFLVRKRIRDITENDYRRFLMFLFATSIPTKSSNKNMKNDLCLGTVFVVCLIMISSAYEGTIRKQNS